MAKTKPKAGARYRSVSGTAPPGFEVIVRDVVPADVAGAHDDSEDAVVVTWEQPGVVIDDGAEPRIESYTDDQGRERTRAVYPQTYGMVPRAVSVGLSVFADQYEAV